jgi:hypothetical protein
MPSKEEQPITRPALRAELDGLEGRFETRLLAAIGQAKTEMFEAT